MENSKKFLLVTHTDEPNLKCYDEIVQLLKINNYILVNEGVSVDKRYFWEFIGKTQQQLKEHQKTLSILKPRDEEYFKKMDEQALRIIQGRNDGTTYTENK